MTLLMKSEFATRQGVGASAVSNWVRKGLIVFGTDPARPGKQLVDVEKSELLIRGTIDQTRGRPRSAEVAQADNDATDAPVAPVAARPIHLSGPEAARMEEMRERTLGRRIENERNLGRLVQLPEVERRTADRGRMIRERTLSLLRQQSERVAAETDPRKIYALQADEFEQLFGRIADEIEAEASAEAQADVVLATIADDTEDDEAEAA